MGSEIRLYALQLRRLADEYYHRQVTMADYRAQRKRILDQLEAEFAGNADNRDAVRAASADPPR